MLPVEVTEAFHLAFLSALQQSVEARQFVLKGGANLRFYYDSFRYSEDIDLDVPFAQASLFTLKVQRAFESPLLARLLRSMNISIAELNPKDRTSTKEKDPGNGQSCGSYRCIVD